jgi:hypothetical protein
MRLTGQHPRLIHDSRHAPSLAHRERQITQPRQTTSQPAVIAARQCRKCGKPVSSYDPYCTVTANVTIVSGPVDSPA